MWRHTGAELLGEHLGTEANAEEWPLLAQRDLDPVDLAANVIVRVVGAHGPDENHGTGMRVQSGWQRIDETRTADVELIAERAQDVADPAGTRAFLMQDDQDRQQKRGRGSRDAIPRGELQHGSADRLQRHWSRLPCHRVAIIT